MSQHNCSLPQLASSRFLSRYVVFYYDLPQLPIFRSCVVTQFSSHFCDAPKTEVSVDNPSTRGIPLSHIMRPIHHTHQNISNQLYYMVQESITLLIQTYIKIENPNTCFFINIQSKSQVGFLLKTASNECRLLHRPPYLK